MTTNTRDFISRFKSLFKAREDVYAVGIQKEDRTVYMPDRTHDDQDIPLTNKVLLDHFKGKKLVGVYPLFDDTQTKWVAIDFDSKSWDDAFRDAKKQKQALQEEGILSYIERSKSGTGAHVWIFFNEDISAHIARSVVGSIIVDSDIYDRMFPNQDSSQGKYGNLIVLPYHGTSFKEGNTAFVDNEGNAINPKNFLRDVRVNDVSFIKNIYDSIEEVGNRVDYIASDFQDRNLESLPGAIKVTKFCSWMQEAKKRMHQQNQEPEFYALCLQFAQLEQGEELAYEYGRLHPYSDARIKEKFEHAKEANMPHTCKTLREEFGFECTCDIDYGVDHPYELAKVPFDRLLGSRRGKPESWAELNPKIIERTKEVYRSGETPGWPFGNDEVDNLTSIRKGELIILGARTKIGKTSYATHLTYNLTSSGIPVYWISLEMSKEELSYKYLGRAAEVDWTSIRNGTLEFSEWRKILKTQKRTVDFPLFIDDQTMEMDFVIDVIGNLISNHGPGLVVVDYIELFRQKPGENPKSMTERVIIELKGLAKILDVPVLALSNFNRSAENDIVEGNDPRDGWLRNTGMLEQTADVVLYLLGHQSKGIQKRNLRIQHDRHTGAGGEQVQLWFDGSTSKFMDHHPRLQDNEEVGFGDNELVKDLFNKDSSIDSL